MRCRAGQDNHRGQGKEVTTDQCEEGISEELFKNGEVNLATMKARDTVSKQVQVRQHLRKVRYAALEGLAAGCSRTAVATEMAG